MGTIDEIKASFGDDFFTRPTASTLSRHTWRELCSCGHHDGYHAATIGGSFKLKPSESVILRGETWTKVHLFNGCVGALPARGSEPTTVESDRELMVSTETMIPTCPCTSFSPVARIDRPNRFFCQRVPLDLDDRSRHPFMLGLRAFTTHLSKRRAALTDPSWPAAEFDRRFIWIDGARACSISHCKATDDVWPVFVDDRARSELRCPAHR